MHDSRPSFLGRKGFALAAVVLTGIGVAATSALSGLPLGTTINDFHQGGTQPNVIIEVVQDSSNCASCHGFFDVDQEPYTRWQSSMMAQSARDPIFYAGLAVANQDAGSSGEYCLRCHAPGAWLQGRSTPADGSALSKPLGDFDGVTCHVCHRMVDPVFDPKQDDPIDRRIDSNYAEQVVTPGNGQYVIDPFDVRRGPFDLGPNFYFHAWQQSAFHREALLCANCHQVSNPTLSKQGDGSYKLNRLDTPHPTQNAADEFPIERTYGEWAASDFAVRPIEVPDANGNSRFGGNLIRVATCQDCHMPKTTGTACNPVLGGALRPDLPLHNFNGVNSWVLDAVRALYPDSETGLSAQNVSDAHGRNAYMMEHAADLDAGLRAGQLVVRVVNQTGHKLPTGYAEGRRMWLNVQFFDAAHQLIAERGHYDDASATLTSADTKVYEEKEGLDQYMAGQTGLAAGESFHFVLNNTKLLDNRIPPRGYSAPAFVAAQAEPVGVSYPEQQYWDETPYTIPAGASYATLRLFQQTTSREYIEFLRDTNTTNNAGQVAYQQWLANGQSRPVLMGQRRVTFAQNPCLAPIAYGLGLSSSTGRVPALGYGGTTSVAANNFALLLEYGIPSQTGFALASAQSATTPFAGGRLYLASPSVRLGSFTSDGQGHAALHVNLVPALIGQARDYQLVLRDPASASGYGLSNALHAEFAP